MKPAPATILDVLRQKCAFKGIPVPNIAMLDPARPELEADWAHMLGHQLPSLPPVAVYWDGLPAVFAWIEGAAQPPAPMAFPLAAGDVVLRGPAGGLAIPGIASMAPIETIRFAASNRLCIELDYTDERGRRGVRIIEPYSVRRTQAGDTLLHAVRADDGGNRSYRVDRINSARATDRVFAPRYAIELTPAGPLTIPPTTRTASITASPAPARIKPHGGRHRACLHLPVH
jgi:hypothetical protein